MDRHVELTDGRIAEQMPGLAKDGRPDLVRRWQCNGLKRRRSE